MQKKLLFLILCISLSGSVLAMDQKRGEGETETPPTQELPQESKEPKKEGSFFGSGLSALSESLKQPMSSFSESFYNVSLFTFVATLPWTIKKLNIRGGIKESVAGLMGLIGLGIYLQRNADVNEKIRIVRKQEEGEGSVAYSLSQRVWDIVRVGDTKVINKKHGLEGRKNFLNASIPSKTGAAAGLVAVGALVYLTNKK